MTRAGRGERLEDLDDAELVARSRAGDRGALEVLLRRHHERIHLLCHRLCRDRGDAEDATQNALLAIVRGLVGFDGSAAFSTWSHRVATNACLDELRRRSRRPVTLAHDGTGTAEFGDPTPAGAGRWSTNGTRGRSDAAGTDPSDLVVGAEQRTRLQLALAELSDEFRIPVVLRDVGELDYAEIAELLDLAPGTVRSRISRGRRKLAELLGSREPVIDSEPLHSDDSGLGNPGPGTDVREVEP